MSSLGIVFVGLNGAVASTVVAGVALMRKGLAPRIGMLTERQGPGSTNLPDGLPLANLDDLRFAGWDPKFDNTYAAAQHHEVFSPDLLRQVREPLESVQPWTPIGATKNGASLSHRAEIEKLERDIRAWKQEQGVERAVMVNLASTEPFCEPSPAHESLEAFEAALDNNDPSIRPAMRYFYVAMKNRIPHCNFTPSLTHIPALSQLAEEMRVPFAGMDGKTGQTLVKTALAPMFRGRRLHVTGWYSVNVLGNSDGETLNAPDANKTKVVSKASVLDSVVGYEVGNHQVHIHYYPPRGDAKEAWDNIDFQGFCGVPMQMKVNFLCQDSILAAPLVIDLVRLLDLASKAGEHGIQRALGMYFKSPYHAPGETPVHDFFEQERALVEWASGLAPRLENREWASKAI